MKTRDYRTYLRRRKVKPFAIKRTEKRPGDVEIVCKGGEESLFRYGDVA